MSDLSRIATIILAIVVLVPLGIWVGQLLWNYVMPDVFGVTRVTFLQMGALYLLALGFFGMGR